MSLPHKKLPPPFHPDAELKRAFCACGQWVDLVYRSGTKTLVFKEHTEKIVRPGNMRAVRCDRGSDKEPASAG